MPNLSLMTLAMGASIAGVLLQVHAADEHGRVILRGSTHNDMLGARIDVALAQLFCQVLAGTLADIFRTHRTPGNILDLRGGEHRILLTVDDQAAVVVLHGAGELAVDRIILQHIGHVFRIHKRVVDGRHLYILVGQRRPEHQATDTAKAVDADFRNHKQNPFPSFKRTKVAKNRLRKRLFLFEFILSWLLSNSNQHFA